MASNTSAASYKYQFVSEPDDDLQCLICLEVAEEPWQHGKCGRLFCEKCLNQHGKNKPCPNCRGQSQYFEDGKSNRAIRALTVKCDSVETGCTWVGTVATLEKHVKIDCQHVAIACKYVSIGCKKELKRKDMAAHEQDGAAHLHMALERINSIQEDHKNGEPIKLILTDYKKRKDNDEDVTSPPYYTSSNGYHVAMEVDANGDGKGEGTHISVFVWFIKGRYDKQLKWPFIGDIHFTLLNQLEDKNHHEQTATVTADDSREVGDTCGISDFIPHSALGYDAVYNTQYLKDDTLYFRMSVKPANHKPWLQ